MKKQVGQTKDVGFQFGIRRSFPISTDKAWEYLFSEKGLNTWLGEFETKLQLKKEFQTNKGVVGLIRVLQPNSHIRLNWKRKHWKNQSTVQIRVIENQKNTTISFHQEKLIDSKQRAEMKDYWNEIMKEISKEITKASR